jgi:hypothetical protein
MNDVLCAYLRRFMFVFFDNILIYNTGPSIYNMFG